MVQEKIVVILQDGHPATDGVRQYPLAEMAACLCDLCSPTGFCAQRDPISGYLSAELL